MPINILVDQYLKTIVDFITYLFNVIIQIIKTFAIITKPKMFPKFLIWFIYIILLGNLGIFLTFINGSQNPNVNVFDKNLQLGNFYSVSIPLCSSFIAMLLIEILDQNIKFRTQKVLSLAITWAFVLIMAILYMNNFITGKSDDLQFGIYILSIIIVIYLFCLSYMKDYYDEYRIYDEAAMNNMELGLNQGADDRGNRL